MSRDENSQIEKHPLMSRYINYYKKLKDLKLFNIQTFYNFAFSILYAPFYTIAISRQLSVTPHKEIYGDYKPENKNSKELMKLQNELTLREAKNFELIKQSGVIDGQKPYRAPIYDNYLETIKGLYRQGVLSFYKGNLYRLVTNAASQRCAISLQWYLRENYPSMAAVSFLRDWMCMSACDIALHLGFVIENRFILQNRLPTFNIYKNALQLYMRSNQEVFRGAASHILKNFLFLFGFYASSILYKADYLYSVLLGTFCSYPFLTAFRRVVCESSSMPGLLPVRYLNTIHALFLIRKEEGLFKGLYKGFFSYVIGTFIWVAMVPGLARLEYYKQQVKQGENLFENDPVFEEIKRRKIVELKKS